MVNYRSESKDPKNVATTLKPKIKPSIQKPKKKK